MCGRFTLSVSDKPDLANLGLQAQDRFNIAPQSDVLMRRETGSFALERWGLTMSVSGRDKLVSNARLETLDAKRLFRDLAPCVLLADGWYEWQRVGSGKQPWYHHRNGLAFSMAGVHDPDQGCVIVTREAAAPLTQIHHRQPLLLNVLQRHVADPMVCRTFETTVGEHRRRISCSDQSLRIRAASS